MILNWIFDLLVSNITTLLVAGVVFQLTFWLMYSRKNSSLPPGLPCLPIIGSLPWIGVQEETFPNHVKKYGDVFSFYIFSRPVVVLWGYENFREAITKDQFADRPRSIIFSKINLNMGILSADGPLWKEHRSFTLRSLRDFGVGKKSLQGKILEEIDVCVNEIAKQYGKPYDVVPILPVCVSNILCNIMFGERFEHNDSRLEKFLADDQKCLANLSKVGILEFFPFLQWLPGDPFWLNTILKCVAEKEDFYKQKIQERRERYDQNHIQCFIDAYLKETEDQKDNPKSTFTELQLIKVLADLFAAGSDTTATTLRWGLLYLMEHQEVQARIQQEIDDVIGPNRKPNMDDKIKMPYTEACINEIQRLANIVPGSVMHAPKEDVVFKGYRIPKGTMVAFPLTSVLWDETVFPEPGKFNPQRFLNEDGSVKKIEQFLPFSMGRRVCLGESLARMELFLFLTSLLQRFTFKSPEGTEIPQFPRPKMAAVVAPGQFQVCAISR